MPKVKYEFKIRNTASADLAKVWAKAIKTAHPTLWEKLISSDEAFHPGTCFTLALESIGIRFGDATPESLNALFNLAEQDRQRAQQARNTETCGRQRAWDVPARRCPLVGQPCPHDDCEHLLQLRSD